MCFNIYYICLINKNNINKKTMKKILTVHIELSDGGRNFNIKKSKEISEMEAIGLIEMAKQAIVKDVINNEQSGE